MSRADLTHHPDGVMSGTSTSSFWDNNGDFFWSLGIFSALALALLPIYWHYLPHRSTTPIYVPATPVGVLLLAVVFLGNKFQFGTKLFGRFWRLASRAMLGLGVSYLVAGFVAFLAV